MRWIGVILGMLLLVVGCGPAAGGPEPEPTVTAVPLVMPTVDGEAAGTRFEFVAGESVAGYVVEETFLVNSQGQGATSAGPAVARGVTSGVTGFVVLNLDGERPVLTAGELTADLRLLASNDERRDLEVNRNWLETAVYPLARFVPTEIRGFPDGREEGEMVGFELVGFMEIRGVVREVVFVVDGVLDEGVLRGTAEAEILMTDFGFDPPQILGIVRAENEVLVGVEFVAREE